MKRRSKTGLIYIAVPAILCAVSALAIAMSRNVRAVSTTAADARSVYNSKCANCHDRDGRARSAKAKRERSRDLTTAEWQDSVSDERIYNAISNGKGKKMPAFKKKLSDAQMDELVNYVRRLRR